MDRTVQDALVLRIDGGQPICAETVLELGNWCERAEDAGPGAVAVVTVAGTPGPNWTDGLTIGLVSKWERSVRRLERLPLPTIGVAVGDCGGTALDAYLATDYRIADRSLRLHLPAAADGSWPGMALYRLANRGGSGAAIRRAALFGKPLDAQDAVALQLIDEVAVDVSDALTAAIALAASVGEGHAIRRRLMLDAIYIGFEEALGTHLAACDRSLRMSQAQEEPS